MKKVFKCKSTAGSKNSNKPRLTNINTDLCVDIKTYLRYDRIAKCGKSYHGTLTRDSEDLFSFRETVAAAAKRNQRVFYGKRITVTQREDGSLRLNFRPVTMGPGFDIAAYATEVANELLWALTSLVGR